MLVRRVPFHFCCRRRLRRLVANAGRLPVSAVSGDEGGRQNDKKPRSRLVREANAVGVNDRGAALVTSDSASETCSLMTDSDLLPLQPPAPLACVVYPLRTLHSISAQLPDRAAGGEDSESCEPNSGAIHPYYAGREPRHTLSWFIQTPGHPRACSG